MEMQNFRRWPVIGAAGLGLLGAPCAGLLSHPPDPPLPWRRCAPVPVLPPGRLPRCTPSLRALRESAYWRTQAAQNAADLYDEECEQLRRWDPQAPTAFEPRRRQLLATDASGALRRSRQAAARAAALAGTPRERRCAKDQLARVDSELRWP